MFAHKQPKSGAHQANQSSGKKLLLLPLVPANVNLSDKQKAQLIATVMAETFQGNANQRDVAWIYLNLIKKYGFTSGMNKSSAFKSKNDWYKVYMIELGYGDDYKDDAPSKSTERWMKVKDGSTERTANSLEEYRTKNEYFRGSSVGKLNAMKTFIEDTVLKKQSTNPYKGWLGQGYYQDLNNRTNEDHWDQVRQYYILFTEGKVKGTYIKVLGSGRKATFIFDREKILQFFKDNPSKLPKDRSKIKKLDGTTVVG